jgi:hypothetical protein
VHSKKGCILFLAVPPSVRLWTGLYNSLAALCFLVRFPGVPWSQVYHLSLLSSSDFGF